MLAIALVYHEKKNNNNKYKHFNKLMISLKLSISKTMKIKAGCLSYVLGATKVKIIVHLLQKDMVHTLITLLTVPS